MNLLREKLFGIKQRGVQLIGKKYFDLIGRIALQTLEWMRALGERGPDFVDIKV